MNNQDFDHGPITGRLIDLLQSVDRPGDYCVGGRLYEPMPQVTLNGVETLSFPVPQAQIDALIDIAERAPYGKGTTTLMDTAVRDCWQIDADQVHVTGHTWPDTFEKIMNLVSKGLGFDKEQLGAKMYKLLVYREGGFFAAHRDTEKIPGMIATLSLSLPTLGEGGELAICHGDQETVFNMSAREPSELPYAAFYSDCLHEARPVTKGHRISLVYNLFIRSGKKWTGAPDYTKLTDKVKACLADWKDHGKTDKIVWLLDHSYTEDGLSFDTLKGTDAAVARVLGEAAENAKCDMHAAVVYIRETGDPEIDYDPAWGGEPMIGSTITELYAREEHLENWVARDGSHPPFGELSIADGELIPLDALEDVDPDEEELEDYMGNSGPTLDLIYRLAALVVWPKAKTLEIVASGGIKNAVSWVATQRDKVSDAEMRHLLSKLADRWPTRKRDYRDYNLPEMLRLLGTTGNADIATDFLDRIVVNHYGGSANASLAILLPVVGLETARGFLSSLIKKCMLERPKEILSLLTLIAQNLVQAELVWRDMLREAVQSAVLNLRAVLEYSSKTFSHEGYRRLLTQVCKFSRALTDLLR
ncbi:MAG: 2OG-Fe(II) oxygenase [Bacteroidetes bacterium]|nr:2OG-Fe(II) oxygenase [Bacteroidota bacterium]